MSVYHAPEPPPQGAYDLVASYALRMSNERDDAMAAATWAVQWLDTVIDRLQHEATIKELFEDMAKVRETNSVLDGEWNRCGWTGTQAARFLKNWRKEEA